jgi:hypothetical protein
MRKTLAAAIGTISAAAVLSGAGLAAASAAPAASGTEHFQAVSTAPASNKSGIIFTGAFTAGGVANVGKTTGTFKLPGGTFKISHHQTSGKSSFNPKTCLLTVSQHGTYTLGHGTDKYTGISGSGKYKLSILAVAQKVHGTCSQSLPPTVFQKIIGASGPVSLP